MTISDATDLLDREPGSTLDFGRALGFTFQDPRWKEKLLIGSLFSLLSLLIVGAFFLLGYNLRLMRNAAQGLRLPLPEWDDMGQLFVDGLLVAVIYLAYTLPVVLLLVGPMILFPVMVGVDDDLAPVAGIGFFLVMTFFTLVILVVSLYLPAAVLRFALEGRLGAAFEVMPTLQFLKRNPLNYFLALVVGFVVQFLAQFGILLCCVGLFPAAVWAGWAYAYAVGEVAWRDAALPPGATVESL